jgi:uncharacterized membrane protein
MAEIVERNTGDAAIVAAPVYLLFFPIPVVCFLAALVTDIAYASTAFLMWLHFSQWLIAGGLAFGTLAGVVLLIEFFASGLHRAGNVAWIHLLSFLSMLVIELLSALVHTIDGWTAVVPWGMALSIVGAILALVSAGSLLYLPVTWVRFRGVRT